MFLYSIRRFGVAKPSLVPVQTMQPLVADAIASIMTDYSIFPKINATLNGCSAVLLVTGRALIARGKMAAHRAAMIAAFVTSTVFLACYLFYHWPGHGGIVYFRGTGWIRALY